MKYRFHLIPIFFFMFSIHSWAKPQKPAYHNGTFIYKIYFEEYNSWMGNTAIVKIKNNDITVTYQQGKITGVKKGELLDSGVIRKHKSGIWLITAPNSPQDVNTDIIGACMEGVTVSKIDFKNKIYWIC